MSGQTLQTRIEQNLRKKLKTLTRDRERAALLRRLGRVEQAEQLEQSFLRRSQTLTVPNLVPAPLALHVPIGSADERTRQSPESSVERRE